MTFTVWCCMKVGSESDRAMERAAARKKDDDWGIKSEQFEKKAGDALEENEQLMEQSDVLLEKYLEQSGYEGDCKDEQ